MQLRSLIVSIVLFMLCSTSYAKNTVLVTGGLTGIGKEISLSFRDAGWEVWATSRNPNKYASIQGVNIRLLDPTNAKAVKKLIKEIANNSGSLDVLVNNAGYGIIGPEEALSVEQTQNILNVNVVGPLLTMQEALPVMRKNHGGKIINVSSTSGIRAVPGLGIYAASKMALEGLSESLAAEVAQWNISVSLIEPGTVNNNWARNAELSDNLNLYPGYKTFTNKLRTKLISLSKTQGQDPQDIGHLAVTIANTDNPDFRYQTSKAANEVAESILVDPTGNKQRDQAIAFANALYEHRL